MFTKNKMQHSLERETLEKQGGYGKEGSAN